jgi:hypothetical protein
MTRHRRLELVSGSILAVVLAVLAVATASSSADRAVTVLPTKPDRPSVLRPPVPRVTTLGVTRAATLVSYCWSHSTPGGGGRGVCADGAPGHPAHILRWRPGVTVTIDLRLPASDVHIEVARIAGFAKPVHNTIGLRPLREDPQGRSWTVQLPRTASRSTDLLIFARFAHGDIYADLGLHSK